MELGIEKIGLVFENCEYVEIPGWMIGEFRLSGFEKVIARIACNAIEKYDIVKTVVMEIAKEADVPMPAFGDSNYKTTLFERLKGKDVTHIHVFYERSFDDAPEIEEIYAVDYDEGEYDGQLGAENINQHVFYDCCGNLYLCISADSKDVEYMESLSKREKSEIEFTYDMYDIGIPFTLPCKLHKKFPPENIRVWVFNKEGHGNYAKYINGVFQFEDNDEVDEPYAWEFPREFRGTNPCT